MGLCRANVSNHERTPLHSFRSRRPFLPKTALLKESVLGVLELQKHALAILWPSSGNPLEITSEITKGLGALRRVSERTSLQ